MAETAVYLRQIARFAHVLDTFLAKKKTENELNPPPPENQGLKLPNKTIKSLMSYFKNLALNESPNIDSSLKRSYLAFYAQLLGIKEFEGLESGKTTADALIVQFIAVISKHNDKSAVKTQGPEFLELLRSLCKKTGGSNQLDAELARKVSFFGEPSKQPKPASQTKNLDLKDIHNELLDIVNLGFPSNDDSKVVKQLSLENYCFVIDHVIAEIYSGRHPIYPMQSFEHEDQYKQVVSPDIQKLEELKHGVPSLEVPITDAFFFPGNTRDEFTNLISTCILRDLGHQTLFSSKTRSVLQFVSQIWCINKHCFSSCLLTSLSQLFENKKVPLHSIRQGIEYILSTEFSNGGEGTYLLLRTWQPNDKSSAINALKKLAQDIIEDVSTSFTILFSSKPVKLGPYIQIIDLIAPLYMEFRQTTILNSNHIKLIKQAIHRVSVKEYESLVSKIPRDSSLNVDHVVELMAEVNKRAKKMQSKYRVPLFEKLPIAKLVSSTFFELMGADFLPLWEFVMRQCELQHSEPSFESMKSLHFELQTMVNLNHKIKGEEIFTFDHEKLVFPYFLSWAEQCGLMAKQWVKPAIEQDDNTPIQGVYYSTSVKDLFNSFHANLSLVQQLQFSPYYNAKLITKIVQGISDTICDWALQTHDIFVASNFVKPSSKQEWSVFAPSVFTPSVFTSFAKLEPPPFSFTFDTGVKLNNISQAFQMMHSMETSLKSDQISEEINKRERMLKVKPQMQTYLFTLTVLGAKDIPTNLTSNANFYVTLIDQESRKTCGRTQMSTNLSSNPKWNEPFEVPVNKVKIMKACLWRQSANGSHDFVGRAQLKLEPQSFANQEYGMQILSLDLDSGMGRLQLMVSVDVQMDDIRFYFGKSLRFLKRMQESMVGSCVAQFSTFIHQTLSLNTLKEVTGQQGLVKSVQRSLMMLKTTSSYVGLGSNANTSAKGTVDGGAKTNANDVQDSPLDPLYDYLNSNFATLAAILTPDLRVDVLSRTWDVVLEAIELLILPPLDVQIPSQQAQLTTLEMETVYSWLSSLREFFYSDGAGPSLERIHSMQYQGIMSIPVYYDLPTNQLKTEAEKVLKSSLFSIAKNSELLMRQRTVMAHRNKSVIEHQTKVMRAAQREQPHLDDVILRILKLRGEHAFIESHLKVKQRLLQTQATQRLLEGQRG